MSGRVLTVGGRRAAGGLLLGKDLFYEVRLADMKHFLFQKCVVFKVRHGILMRSLFIW